MGKEADVVIIDPDAEYTIDARTFVSGAKNNTISRDARVSGEVKYTICGGENSIRGNISGGIYDK